MSVKGTWTGATSPRAVALLSGSGNTVVSFTKPTGIKTF